MSPGCSVSLEFHSGSTCPTFWPPPRFIDYFFGPLVGGCGCFVLGAFRSRAARYGVAAFGPGPFVLGVGVSSPWGIDKHAALPEGYVLLKRKKAFAKGRSIIGYHSFILKKLLIAASQAIVLMINSVWYRDWDNSPLPAYGKPFMAFFKVLMILFIWLRSMTI